MSRPSRHLAASVALAVGQYARTRSLIAAGATFVTGFAIDLDHFADYAHRWAHPGSPRKLFLLAHGWEYVPLIAAAEWLCFRRTTRGSLTLGYVVHLLIDQLTNDTRHPFSYLLTFRASKRFDASLFGHSDDAHAWQDASPRGLLRWL